jgi:DNA-binding transcriptional MerR regulator
VRTIRFYEQCGILPTPERTPGGYRSYDQDAVTRLRFVRSAQTLGLSLAEIADVLRIRDYQGPVGAEKLVTGADHRLRSEDLATVLEPMGLLFSPAKTRINISRSHEVGQVSGTHRVGRSCG